MTLSLLPGALESLSAALAKQSVEKGLAVFELVIRHVSLSEHVRVNAPWIRVRYIEEVFSFISIHYLSLIITHFPSYHTGYSLFILF